MRVDRIGYADLSSGDGNANGRFRILVTLSWILVCFLLRYNVSLVYVRCMEVDSSSENRLNGLLIS